MGGDCESFFDWPCSHKLGKITSFLQDCEDSANTAYEDIILMGKQNLRLPTD